MKRSKDEEYKRHVEETGGDYTVKKSKVLDNIAKVVTLILAFFIWLYVISTTDVAVNETFDLVPIDLQGTESIQANGLAVHSMDFDRINVTLTGTRNALSKVNGDNLSAYVDLSDVREPGVYSRTVKFNMPSGVALAMPSESVQITVDRRETAVFSADAAKLHIDSWSVAEFCRIDRERSAVDIDYVVVDGPSMVLSRVADIRIRSNTTVTLSTNSDVSAVIDLIDKEGNVITDSSLSVKAYQGGSIEGGSLTGGVYRSTVSVAISLIKEKTLPLVAKDSDGFLTSGQITLSPATVVVKGSPAAVDALDALELPSFSAKNLTGVKTNLAYLTLESAGLPEGITEITTTEGVVFADGIVRAEARIAVGETYRLTIPKSYVTIIGGEAALVDDSITLTLRTTGDETYFLLLEQQIQNGAPGINLVVNLTDIHVGVQTVAPVTVIFSSEFEGKVYEIFAKDAPYTATVKAIEN